MPVVLPFDMSLASLTDQPVISVIAALVVITSDDIFYSVSGTKRTNYFRFTYLG